MKKLITSFIVVIPMMIIMAQPPRGDMDKGDRKSMKTMNIWKLTEELELTEEQAEKFFPKFRAQQDKMEKLRDEGKDALKPIFETLKDGKDVSDKDLDAALKKFEKLERPGPLKAWGNKGTPQTCNIHKIQIGRAHV